MQRHLIRLGLVMLTAALLQGCFDKEEPTCAYWVPKILQPAFTEKAIDKTTELQCSDALPAMQQLFQGFISCVAIHHYFVDGAVWKLSNPKVRGELLSHLQG